MTRATELESRGNVFTPFTGAQVSLAMDNASKLRLLPLSEALLRFVNICVQTKAKVRLLSAHKVYKCAPLPCRQNVGVAYG